MASVTADVTQIDAALRRSRSRHIWRSTRSS